MSRQYCDFLIDMLAPWDEVRARAMFGGYGLYSGETFFGLVADDAVYFKVDEITQGDYERAGSQPFAYKAGSKDVTMAYWQVPADVLDDPELIADWADKACAAARRSKTAGRKKRK